jgi:hypothetical protein
MGDSIREALSEAEIARYRLDHLKGLPIEVSEKEEIVADEIANPVAKKSE